MRSAAQLGSVAPSGAARHRLERSAAERSEAARSGGAGQRNRSRPWSRVGVVCPATSFRLVLDCCGLILGCFQLVFSGCAYARERYSCFPLFIGHCSRFWMLVFGFSTAVLLHRLEFFSFFANLSSLGISLQAGPNLAHRTF